MRFGIRTVALATILALHAVASVQATPNVTGYPNSMAATGDSITRAYNTGSFPLSDAPGNSWSTGTRASVGSHYSRILAAQPTILGRNYNDAAVVEGGSLVSLEATDDMGVAGIEYRLNLGAFQRYMGPFVLAAGSNIRFRAVDVNGNIEATQSLTA